VELFSSISDLSEARVEREIFFFFPVSRFVKNQEVEITLDDWNAKNGLFCCLAIMAR
jgi:hypothetical protein